MSRPTTAHTAMSATPMVHSRPVEVATTRITATTPMMGASITRRSSMTTAIWICWMSLVQRVMSEACENRLTSAGEKRMTWAYVSWRRSRAMLAAVREAMAPTATLMRRPTRQSPNMRAAVLAR